MMKSEVVLPVRFYANTNCFLNVSGNKTRIFVLSIKMLNLNPTVTTIQCTTVCTSTLCNRGLRGKEEKCRLRQGGKGRDYEEGGRGWAIIYHHNQRQITYKHHKLF